MKQYNPFQHWNIVGIEVFIRNFHVWTGKELSELPLDVQNIQLCEAVIANAWFRAQNLILVKSHKSRQLRGET
jgi:hypothetical protein